MKSLLSIAAGDFRLSLEAGVVNREEIVRWADGLLQEGDYDDDLAEISMSSNKTDKDLEGLLANIASEDPQWDGFRRMLGRMHDALVREPDRLPAFTRFLERLWIRYDYTLPEDLSFIVGLEDGYLLAEDGQYGSVDAIRNQLIEDLARFTKTNTEQVAPSDGDKPSV